MLEDAARNGGMPNFVDVARHCDVSDRTLRRWWEDQESLNLHKLPPPVSPPSIHDEDERLTLAEAVQTERLSTIWLSLLMESDRDITASREHGSMGSVPSLRKLQVDLVDRYKAAQKEEGSGRVQTPEEVEEQLRAAARVVSPRLAGVFVEELKKRNLA